MSDLINYFKKRTESIDKHYQWLMDYIKTIQPESPQVSQALLLLCDNFANELRILNNEGNYRFSTVVEMQENGQEFQMSTANAVSTLYNGVTILAKKFNELESIQKQVDIIKVEQEKLTLMRESFEKSARERAENLSKEIERNEERLKRGQPGVT